MKKLLATILALVMALGLCSVSWADNDVYTYEDGKLKKNDEVMTDAEVKAFSGVNVIGFKDHDTKVYATVEEAYNELSKLTTEAVGKEGAVADDKVTGLYSQIKDKHISIQWNIWGEQTLPTGYTLSLGREQGYLGGYYLRDLTVEGQNDAAQLTASTITVPWSYQYASNDDESVILSISDLKLLDSDENGIKIARNGKGLGGTFTFNLDNCKVDGGFNMSGAYQGNSVWNISNNTFTCRAGGYTTYPLMLNGTAEGDAGNNERKTVLNFTGNTVSGYVRGLNFNAYAGDLVVTGNKITPGAGYSAVQVTCCDTALIEGNEIHLNGGNVLTIHESFANRGTGKSAKITVKNNIIDGSGYAVYDDVTASGKAYGEGVSEANVKLVWQNNPCATMKTDTGIKGSDVKATAPAIAQIVSAGSTPSTGGYYYHPTTDTKADETKGSPKTFDAGVGIYAVTAVLSVTGMAWTAKKRH